MYTYEHSDVKYNGSTALQSYVDFKKRLKDIF